MRLRIPTIKMPIEIFSAIAAAIVVSAGVTFSLVHRPIHRTIVHKTIIRPVIQRGVRTIYIEDFATKYISLKEIKNDIPAWTQAINKNFAPIWSTPQVRFKIVKRNQQPPRDALVAVFKKRGPIRGALAFHYTLRGNATIVVYAGTDNYYGYSNSVSFTHEAFEFLADPTIAQTNQGWPYPYYYVGNNVFQQIPGTVWAQEVCDPVEKYTYKLPGANGKPVQISDFITPNWFNDHMNGPYDWAHVVQQPFDVVRGGYAQFWSGYQWIVIKNFRHVGPDAAGFLIGEHHMSNR